MSTRDTPHEDGEEGGRHSADEMLAAALAVGSSVQKAAEKAEVSESTAHRRLRSPAFRRRLKELRALIVDQAVSLASAGLCEAIMQLRLICREGKGEARRLLAAEKLVNAVLAIREHASNEAELAALEEAVRKKKKRRGSK
jgi:hypothetical protein